MRQLAVLATLLIALGAWHGTGEEHAEPLSRCGYRWTIPAEHSSALQQLQQVVRGGEQRASFGVDLTGDHLAAHIPGYHAEVERVTGRVTALVSVIPHEHLYLHETAVRLGGLDDKFMRSGLYSDLIVEENPTPPGFYRIWEPQQALVRGWTVSRVDPRLHDTYLPRDEWFIASCSWAGGHIPGTSEFETCRFSRRIARDINVHFSLRGPNVALHGEIVEHVAAVLRASVRIPEDDPHCFDNPFHGFPKKISEAQP